MHVLYLDVDATRSCHKGWYYYLGAVLACHLLVCYFVGVRYAYYLRTECFVCFIVLSGCMAIRCPVLALGKSSTPLWLLYYWSLVT
jgi:hypothetical protein